MRLRCRQQTNAKPSKPAITIPCVISRPGRVALTPGISSTSLDTAQMATAVATAYGMSASALAPTLTAEDIPGTKPNGAISRSGHV